MIKKLIELGLTFASIASLKNNFTEVNSKEKFREIQKSNKQISNFRNFAYILRRLMS